MVAGEWAGILLLGLIGAHSPCRVGFGHGGAVARTHSRRPAQGMATSRLEAGAFGSLLGFCERRQAEASPRLPAVPLCALIVGRLRVALF